MTALTRFFFDPVYAPRSAWSVIGWWEGRRSAFNLAIGGAGVLTLTVLNLFAALPPYGMWFGFPLVPLAVYALLANVAFTAGPIADLLIRRAWGNRYAAVGPTLFRYGFVFSVGLTLLPIPLAAALWALRLVRLFG
ncbi:MAG: hypothetical protein OEY20_11640 [Gemmatimonadota bacterium]|nr:hypothetical protein [Gemmatimonadota bacterium]MDH4351542.1 hypothetical protein [Gemmatimonadota bacterium]MDH5197893.1 hypothetical protein [Gemmatimonadota bacterium]